MTVQEYINKLQKLVDNNPKMADAKLIKWDTDTQKDFEVTNVNCVLVDDKIISYVDGEHIREKGNYAFLQQILQIVNN